MLYGNDDKILVKMMMIAMMIDGGGRDSFLPSQSIKLNTPLNSTKSV